MITVSSVCKYFWHRNETLVSADGGIIDKVYAKYACVPFYAFLFENTSI